MSHVDLLDLFHTVGVPVSLGLGLSFLKLLAENKAVTFEEANGISLDLILVCVGALSAFWYRGRSVDAISGAVGGDFLMLVILLLIRSSRARRRAKMSWTNRASDEVGWFMGLIELLIGIFSVYWTVKAP